MPGPIAISRNSPESTITRQSGMSGSLTGSSNGILGSSFAGASSGSFREAIAASFGKDAADIMDYSIARFSSSVASTDSDMTALPSTSLPRTKIDNTFCSNFKCCGQALENLHDLLQHYEEAHVKFEDDDVPAMITDDEAHSPSSSATASQPPSPKSTNAIASSSSSSTSESALDTNEHLSAFDTTIMRSPFKGKKRSFGQFANGASNGQVHQSLRRALIDNGLGRSNSRASSVYSANSPFSTPGGSIPGTPTADNDMEAAFFGGGSGSPAFSSLSLRNNNEDHDLPSCAPPNLFFPAAGSSSISQLNGVVPPAKREKTASMANSSAALENSLANPGALGDRPYKCTSPGCDKAYKQMNGLKYHRLHGQCNQNNLPPQQQLSAVVNDNANAVAASANSIKIDSAPPTPTSENGDESPTSSSPDSKSSMELGPGALAKGEKMYICQVGACGKRYKNLNGLRYHYLHSGSHGLLGLQLLHANGGGPSARADATTGRPAISTNDLSSDALAAAAQAAAAQQQAKQREAVAQQQTQQAQAVIAAAIASSQAPSTAAASTTPEAAQATPAASTTTPTPMQTV
ncbi:uncharacterized protein FA14DRAFT_192877 [Meira miltonrushii]|uniref:C2H2-type domain-containing protein n=1 Tax=Meira miltonrushii TaxID=1280837 RepID=A0A316V6K6_9BASI|nr:uncharacterized protein FA14DRAFT_192877 [Meira miltonrushii]PWN31823.1 hypothetical protein FA14DRAFT_192877 [Meira miltonrushii]